MHARLGAALRTGAAAALRTAAARRAGLFAALRAGSLAALLALAPAVPGCAGRGAAPAGEPAPLGPETAIGPAPPAPPEAGPERGEEGPFPSPQELRELGEPPAPGEIFSGDVAHVESWTLRGPFPERIGDTPVDDPGPLEALLTGSLGSRAGLVVLSEAMRCVARESGLFFLEHGAAPDPALRRFIRGRCGATGQAVQLAWYYGDVPPGADEAQVARAWELPLRGQVFPLLAAGPSAGPRAAGIWYGHSGGRGLVLLASALRRGVVEPTDWRPGPDGRVVLRGEVLLPAEEIGAQVTRGPLGFARCEADPDVALPRFALTCPVAPGDERAWLSLWARPPGRILGEALTQVLLRPDGGEARTWRRPSYGATARATDPHAFRDALLAEVNRLRAGLDMPPLAFEARESRSAERLAPFYFGSVLGMLPPSHADVVALGLMAGWEVEGTIRDARMGGDFVWSTSEVDRWLGEVLEMPGARALLLDPTHARVAVGALAGTARGQPYLAAVLATYELFDDLDPAALRQDLYTDLDRSFDARGMGFPRRARALEDLAEREAHRVQEGEASPREALQVVIQEAATRLRTSVRGWVLEGEPGSLELPEGIFEGDPQRIAAAVGWYRPPGSPWGREFALLLLADEAPLRSARRQARAGTRPHAPRAIATSAAATFSARF